VKDRSIQIGKGDDSRRVRVTGPEVRFEVDIAPLEQIRPRHRRRIMRINTDVYGRAGAVEKIAADGRIRLRPIGSQQIGQCIDSSRSKSTGNEWTQSRGIAYSPQESQLGREAASDFRKGDALPQAERSDTIPIIRLVRILRSGVGLDKRFHSCEISGRIHGTGLAKRSGRAPLCDQSQRMPMPLPPCPGSSMSSSYGKRPRISAQKRSTSHPTPGG